MTDIKKRVAVLPWPDMENCFLCISGAIKKKEHYGDKWYTNAHQEHVTDYHHAERSEPRITFAYRGENVAVEWDGEHGPIQVWYKCDKDYQESEWDKARPHWLYDYAHGSGCWSQMAVDEHHLVKHFNQGDYAQIFQVLSYFAKEREV